MDVIAKPVGKAQVLFCAKCDRQLEMGWHMIAYCPTCRACSRGTQAVATDCHTKCENVLAVTQEGGLYCIYCHVFPGIGNTFYLNQPD